MLSQADALATDTLTGTHINKVLTETATTPRHQSAEMDDRRRDPTVPTPQNAPRSRFSPTCYGAMSRMLCCPSCRAGKLSALSHRSRIRILAFAGRLRTPALLSYVHADSTLVVPSAI